MNFIFMAQHPSFLMADIVQIIEQTLLMDRFDAHFRMVSRRLLSGHFNPCTHLITSKTTCYAPSQQPQRLKRSVSVFADDDVVV